MRTASLDQSTPTALAKISVVVSGDTHTSEGSGNERVMRVSSKEQAYGSVFFIELDNADGSLDTKSYEGYPLTLNMAFDGQTADNFPPLWVHMQQHVSQDGKLLLQLTCVDAWSFLQAAEVTYTGAQFNQHWQTATELDAMYMPDEATLVRDVPALYNDLLANGNKTIWEVIQYLCPEGGGGTPVLVDTDSYIQTLKPPLHVTNIRSGIKQALDMTSCYLKIRASDGVFITYKPTDHATVFTFDTLNTFYTNAQEAAVTIPNKVQVWAYNELGTLWIDGEAVDNDSYTRMGNKWVPRHYYVATLDTTNQRTQAQLESMAAGFLDKIKAERAQGVIVAPMHVSLEVFDKVEVTDSRYTPSRTITGYVHQIEREYDRGVYRITIYLGGTTGGYTVPGGAPAPGLADGSYDSPPPASGEATAWTDILPKAIQGYTHDITFSSTSASNITWSSGTIKFYDGTTQAILSGSGVLPDGTPPPIQYIIFDLDHASPNVLQMVAASDYLTTYFSEYTSVLCVAQRGQGDRAIFLPGWDKQPLIVTDMIYMAGLRDYVYPDGTSLHGIYSTEISSGYIKLTANTTYATDNLDPTKKRQVFQATPTTPYYIGDIWVSGSTFRRCTTTRETGSYSSGDWTVVSLDSITDGTSYKRVSASTVNASGYIYLSYVVEDGEYVKTTSSEKTTWNAKNRVFRQSTTPSAIAAGDLWYDSGNNDKCYRASATGTGNWVRQYTEIDGGHIKTGTIDASSVTIQSGSSGDRITIGSLGISVIGTGLKFYNPSDLYRGDIRGTGTSGSGVLYIYGTRDIQLHTAHQDYGIICTEAGFIDVPVRTSPPSGTQTGRFWFDTTKNLLCYYRPGYGNRFIQDGAY